jgi:ring-1,2-phenylacetyl-CoA epoxidase subunit PaaC
VSGPNRPALARYTMSLGDDALVLCQRLCAWAARAPVIEEDVALLNIALDLLGHARSLLAYAGEVEGEGRTEDDLAYLRGERDFLNVHLVEMPNGDFARTMARQLLFSAYQCELYQALSASADAQLAAIAAKAYKEVLYHREHAALWTERLGDGTEESHARATAALEDVWPYAAELFDDSGVPAELVDAGVAPRPSELRAGWVDFVTPVLAAARLQAPAVPDRRGGGRRGLHTEALGYLLAEMQHLHRCHPGVTW